ncbi:MAG: hypothetical protein V3T17_16095 [Pseudomonadales bacterium]
MSDDKKAQVDSETILMTLDQIGQTIDIMTNVVGRLRGYITEQLDGSASSSTKNDQPTHHPGNPQTLH